MLKHGSGSRIALMLVCAVLFLGLVSAASAATSNWDSFQYAGLEGISMTPSVDGDVTTYTVALGLDAKITLATGTYDIDWIQGVFVLSGDEMAAFTATDNGNSKSWGYDTSKIPPHEGINVAGWAGNPNASRLRPGESMTVSLNGLSFGDAGVVPGFHVGYTTYVDGVATPVSASFKEGPPPVPEPSSLFALMTGAVGMAGFVIRRKK